MKKKDKRPKKNTTAPLDFESDSKVVNVSDGDLRRLSDLAINQIALEDEIEEQELHLKNLQSSLNEVRTNLIPVLMDEIGVQSITLSTGEKVEVKASVKASITEKNKEAAFLWLKNNGHDSLIKNEVIVSFGRGEDSVAKIFLEKTSKNGQVCKSKKTVNPQTLAAFVREMMNDGQNVPEDLFGVFRLVRSKITRKP